MSKLKQLHRDIEIQRLRRILLRRSIALTALANTVLATLFVLFLIDVSFQIDVFQRLVTAAVGIGVLVWVSYGYSLPRWTFKESKMDIALKIRNSLDDEQESDLVAALQFESPEASNWGSKELISAVIYKVADKRADIHLQDAVNRKELFSLSLLSLASTIVLTGIIFFQPERVNIFAHRLLLSGRHYPAKTVLEQLQVNSRVVWDNAGDSSQPEPTSVVEDRPIIFSAWCSGVLPNEGTAAIVSLNSRNNHKINLVSLAAEDILAYREVFHADDPISSVSFSQKIIQNLAVLTRYETGEIHDALHEPMKHVDLKNQIFEDLSHIINMRPVNSSVSLFVGKLPRMLSDIEYQIRIGDTWTDPAVIRMISEPVLEVQLDEILPEYARTDEEPENTNVNSMTRRVYRGSEVRLSLRCANKSLQQAWVTTEADGISSKSFLRQRDSQGNQWELAKTQTLFSRVLVPFGYKIQVIDEDGLERSVPLAGVIELERDRPPRVSAVTIHRNVMPNAHPTIDYQVADDLAIAKLELQIEIDRRDKERETVTRPLMEIDRWISQKALPLKGSFPVDLAPLKLCSGDRLSMKLLAVDYREDLQGGVSTSEELLLSVSGQEEVLQNIFSTEAQTGKQLDEIISLQLSVGERNE